MNNIRQTINLIESLFESDNIPEWITDVIPTDRGPVAIFNHVNYAVKLRSGEVITVRRVEFDVSTGVIRVYFGTSDTGVIASDSKLYGLDEELMPLFKKLFAPYDLGNIHRSTVGNFIQYDAADICVVYGSYYLSGQVESAWFEYLSNMDYETKLRAVKSDPDYIRYIDNPNEELQMTAVKQYPWSIQYIDNPTEAVQITAIKDNADVITYIENPTILNNPEVKTYIIKYMLGRMKDNATVHVTNILAFLREHGVNWSEFAAFDRSLAANKLGK